jgi:hypothetical protein
VPFGGSCSISGQTRLLQGDTAYAPRLKRGFGGTVPVKVRAGARFNPNASPADRVSKALTALGRVCKTIFILRYIADEPQRRMIQRQLNRGEARNALTRWISFANQGEFQVGDYEEIMNKASYLSLLSNATVLWNTMQMARIAKPLREADNELADEDLAHVWPLQRTRIIPNGTYFLNWPQIESAAITAF